MDSMIGRPMTRDGAEFDQVESPVPEPPDLADSPSPRTDPETIDFGTVEVTRTDVTEYHKTATVRAGRALRGGTIPTLEGDHSFEAGDYIAGPGAGGEFWPVKAAIFEATYAAAAQEAPAPDGLLHSRAHDAVGAWTHYFDAHDRVPFWKALCEAMGALAVETRKPAPPSPAEPPRPPMGSLEADIELELGLHNPGPRWECDCGDQLPGETFWHHVARAVDYRLTATDGDA